MKSLQRKERITIGLDSKPRPLFPACHRRHSSTWARTGGLATRPTGGRRTGKRPQSMKQRWRRQSARMDDPPPTSAIRMEIDTRSPLIWPICATLGRYNWSSWKMAWMHTRLRSVLAGAEVAVSVKRAAGQDRREMRFACRVAHGCAKKRAVCVCVSVWEGGKGGRFARPFPPYYFWAGRARSSDRS